MTIPSKKDQKECIQESESITYEELKAHLSTLDDEQLKQHVTVYNSYTDEYEPVTSIDYASEDGSNDVLDAFHPFLVIQG